MEERPDYHHQQQATVAATTTTEEKTKLQEVGEQQRAASPGGGGLGGNPTGGEQQGLLGGMLEMEAPSDDFELQGILYTVHESPPWYLCIFFGFQHYITMFVATLTVPFLLSPVICMEGDDLGKSEVIGTLFVASGVITILQTVVGVRLPVVQAGTFALLAPTLAYFKLPAWQCPNIGVPEWLANSTSDGIGNVMGPDNVSYVEIGSEAHRDIWKTRLREVQGSLMIAALFEAFLGLTGVVGVLLRYIGPLTICPTISMLGLSLFRSAAVYAEHQWWICLVTIIVMIIFSQYLGWVTIPCLTHKKGEGWVRVPYPFFKMFPVILAISIAWFLCFILTVTDVLPNDPSKWGYGARTDRQSSVIYESPWFRIPYPFQWGLPTASISCVCGLLSGIISTTIESVGDYHAYARLSGAPCPPTHAINRGIFVEGIGSFLDGMFGTGNGTTSTSINVGVVGLTKVGSRRVVQYSALFMIGLGVFTKFGALFVTIPEPVIGGSFYLLFGLIVAVGISNLQYVSLNSSRNMFIIGFSFLIGLSVPEWVKANPTSISTGNDTVDQTLQLLLSTSMFVGGVSGFFFDNTLSGTPEERGMAQWNKTRMAQETNCSPALVEKMSKVYDLPCGMNILRRMRWTRYLPICPTYGTAVAMDDTAEPEEVAVLNQTPQCDTATATATDTTTI